MESGLLGRQDLLEMGTNTLAEIWAFRDGLLLAKQFNIKNLEIELDASVVISMLNTQSSLNLLLQPLISDCRMLVRQFDEQRILHVFREGNRCADALACYGSKDLCKTKLYILVHYTCQFCF